MRDNILAMLGISDPSDEITAKLDYIISSTQQRLLLRLGVNAVPAELEYIVVEVSIARFNRIGSERLSSHNVEGETMTWNSEDDFKPYLSEISAWVSQNSDSKYQGRLKFI